MMVTVTTTYKVEQQQGELSLARHPVCMICKQERFAVTQAPYGSWYAGKWICDDCWRKHLDPAITKAIEAREGKKEDGSQD